MSPTDQELEAKDQQGLDHTCGERWWVEFLALGGAITTDQMQGLVPELWNVVNPGWSMFASGTSIQDMVTLAQYLVGRFPIHFHMEALYPDFIADHLDADDQGGIINVVDSCKQVDFGTDHYTPEQMAQASIDAVGGRYQVGWTITMFNADKSATLAKAECIVVDLSDLTPVSGMHWLLAH